MTRPAVPACPTDEPLDTLVFRPLAARLVERLAPTRVTANQVSLAGAFAGVGAAACLVAGGGASAIGAPVLLALSLVLDVADGQLARHRRERTHAGWVMDILSDAGKGVAVFVALAVALARGHGPSGLAWGVAAGLSVLVQVLLRDHSLHRFAHESAPAPESRAERHARIHAERLRLRAGPPTLARLAMAAYDLALAAVAPFGGDRAEPTTPRRLGPAERERRLAAQGVWRHLGGSAQLVAVAAGAAAGGLLPAAMTLVTVGNAVLAAAAVLEVRADALRVKTAELRRKSA